ncbi:cell division ATP-binding protein FtsE [Garicola koreensis]|uniref:Cell division ATP-binding protein FtsE n=1 Tax=Garicola koreensis TaxID=1262554 RepID=A0A7W5U1C8_9MICC|nr:cell division ATP-binding protein FtsE [Garicola koreensis]MBB3667441.1 cell division transport system ATP-binding protein [Garicola koreensis]
MIRFEHVTRHYGDADAPALSDISIEFNRADFVFLIGASGSGKSSLLRMVLRESLPQQGKVSVAGQNLSLMLERRVPEYRRSIGMVFQDFRLLPDKTVYDNVAFAMRVIGASRSTIRKQVMKILSRVKLDHLAKRFPHEISGGEQQRAAIARAIVNSPAIILADEPTGNLDPRASEEVMKILRWINASGTTVIMATHDRPIVDRMSRRVVQLHQGKLVRDEPNGLYDPPEGSEAWEILSAEEAATGLRASDPMPQRTQLHSVVAPAAPAPGSAPSSDAETAAPTPQPTGPQAPEPHARAAEPVTAVNHYRVTWPQDDAASDSASDSQPGAGVDAADLPQFDAIPAAETEPAEHTPAPGPAASSEPTPATESAEPTTDPVDTVPAAPKTGSAPRLNWLSHAEDQSPPTAEPKAEQQSEVPRPRASAAEATYAESQRTAEQIRSSKGGLFRRSRRQR